MAPVKTGGRSDLIYSPAQDTASNVVCSVVCMRLDYCNFTFYGVPESNINSLQRVQNALARLV